MYSKNLRYIGLFVAVVLIQVLLLNNFKISGYINPFFYILFLLLLPLNMLRYQILLLGFFLGLTIDVFSDTPGLNAFATVFVAYVRPYILGFGSAAEESDRALPPTILTLGFGQFVKYAALIIVIHHVILFFIEAFTFSGIFFTLLKSIASSLFTLVLVILSQFIFFRK